MQHALVIFNKKDILYSTFMSPIAIFTYNRPDHLRKCISSLKSNFYFKKTRFFIFQDALKSVDKEISKKYHLLFKDLPSNFTIIRRNKNYGLKFNIIDGVSYVLSKFKNIIVCEDDLIFQKYFIYYMNSMIQKYEKNKSISCVSGFSYVFRNQLKQFPEEYLLKLTSSWGWATRREFWSKFLKSDLSLEKKNLFSNKKLQYIFDYDDAQSHTLWLKKNSLNQISSWNIEWEFFNFVNSYSTLYPKITFVENRGFDGSGTHCTRADYKFQKINNNYKYQINKKKITFEQEENADLRKIISQNIKQNIIKKNLKKLIYFNFLN
jgi:hypothetical protein